MLGKGSGVVLMAVFGGRGSVKDIMYKSNMWRSSIVSGGHNPCWNETVELQVCHIIFLVVVRSHPFPISLSL
jgi:hypothetical protein